MKLQRLIVIFLLISMTLSSCVFLPDSDVGEILPPDVGENPTDDPDQPSVDDQPDINEPIYPDEQPGTNPPEEENTY